MSEIEKAPDAWLVTGEGRRRSAVWADDDAHNYGPGAIAHHAEPLYTLPNALRALAEDRERVDDLIDACDRNAIITAAANPAILPRATRIELMQAALRSLVAEPEPEEPTGLGAVVKDGRGWRWMRRGGFGYRWIDADPVSTNEPEVAWAGLERPITVLSLGWEPES